MKKNSSGQIESLAVKGVVIPDPSSVFIGPEVVTDQIAPGAVIHPFCRIYGAQTSMGPGCVLGGESPATIENCQLGAGVRLGGGYFSSSTFLDGSSMGACAHVRSGTLMEERSSGAHAVGLKQTVLFPYVVLGSIINFCDCLMAGGTNRKNHSEVGSSYIHFNYTPHQDKATPSLIGDVSRGVLLDQPPIFLGGHGGLVGPVKIAFGVVAPAGVILRKDVLAAGLAAAAESGRAPDAAFMAGAYRAIGRIVSNNLAYIGNICALRMWYRHVRSQFMTADRFQSACLAGALERLETILKERISRLDELAEKMPRSMELNALLGAIDKKPYLIEQERFAARWPDMMRKINQLVQYEGDAARRDMLLKTIEQARIKGEYLETIAALSPESKAVATGWLQSIVDRAAEIWENKK